MSGDYTRVRYSAQSGYIGVLEQQGRVRLDADGNELVESIDRRRRAEAIDTIGHGVVPTTTKSGFEIKLTAGQWTIGPGRAYVDGILVDCWGDSGSQLFQPDLGEMRGTNPLLFQNQPFYYSNSFKLPPPNAASIVYLDVWEREVTALEDPGLIDPAIEGIDTTTRIQAAWQVKALSPTTAVLCGDTVSEWTNLITPPTGVLSTTTTPAPSSGSPCTIDPVAGYTGLENRLYRVQVARTGTVDGATAAQFVWSQENASLGAAVIGITKISATACQLLVTTVGRDKTLGFNVNDNIELLDDFVEWSIRETGRGGTFVTVQAVDPEQLTITVTPDISSSFPFVLAQHPRIRRWDAAPQPTQNGVAIPLGTDGVTATFGASPSATLFAGDYWVFYARTATGTIEVLNLAPPRGVLHHYMRLALVSPSQTIQDCRVFWPAFESCCTVVVNVGDDIQKAIDSLPAAGGCVCLKTGVHLITTPIVIHNKVAISLHGECIGAVVRNTAGGPALKIGSRKGSTTDITVGHITFIATPTYETPVHPDDASPTVGLLPVLPVITDIITITNTERCAVRECHLGSASARPCKAGFWISGGDQIEIRENQVSGVISGVMATNVSNLTVAENRFSGPTSSGKTGDPTLSGGATGIDVPGPAGGIVNVHGNEILDFSQGVVVQSDGASVSATALALQLSIERNLVFRQGLTPGWRSDFGWPAEPDAFGTLLQQKAYAIFTDVPNATISRNTIGLADPGHGGILVSGTGDMICGNVITSSVPLPKTYDWPNLPIGIVGYAPGPFREGISYANRGRIAENTLTGPLKGIAVLSELDVYAYPAIADNRIDNRAIDLQSEQIDLTQIASFWNLYTSLIALGNAFGILTINADRASVTHNVVWGCTAGIATISSTWSTIGAVVDANDVAASTIGIFVMLIEDVIIRDGCLVSNQAAIVLYDTTRTTVTGNRCTTDSGVVHCLDLGGNGNRFEGNWLAYDFDPAVATGLLAISCTDASFIRNTVEGTTGTGIVAAACEGETCLEGNRVSECGALGQSQIEANNVGKVPGFAPHKGWQLDQGVCSGIAVVNCSGVITIDGCAVTDTGQVSDSVCADIVVVGGAHVRVRNCRVVRAYDGAIKSRALLLLLPPVDAEDATLVTVDASGNHIDVTNDSGVDPDFVAVDIECPRTESDIIFVGNMVVQRVTSGKNPWAARLRADSLAITGNRIRRVTGGDEYSLFITYHTGLSYVGNVVTQGAEFSPSKPTKYDHPTTNPNRAKEGAPDNVYNANVPPI